MTQFTPTQEEKLRKAYICDPARTSHVKLTGKVYRVRAVAFTRALTGRAYRTVRIESGDPLAPTVEREYLVFDDNGQWV